MTRQPGPDEHSIQSTFVAWCKRHENAEPRLSTLFAVPNAGRRGYMTRCQMLDEGLRAGVSDMFLACPSEGYHGLFIEFKRRGGDLRPEQVIWQQREADYGYETAVCYSVDEAIQTINEYLGTDLRWE
jgi:hypothetical protein